MCEPPDIIDAGLWVELESYPGRSILIGNAHTFPGRMLAWNELSGHTVKFSKSDVRQSSERSSAWIAGFLAGSEPSVLDVSGATCAADASCHLNWDYEPTEDDFRRWRHVVHQFAVTGVLPDFFPVDLPSFPADIAGRPWPWLESAGDVLLWHDGHWEKATQDFLVVGGFASDSVCAGRRYHDIESVPPNFLMCTDCGNVDFNL